MTKRKNSHNEIKLNIKLNIRLNISQKHYMGHGWWNSLSLCVKVEGMIPKSQVALLVIKLRFSKKINFIVWSLKCQNMSKSNDLLIIKKFQCKLK